MALPILRFFTSAGLTLTGINFGTVQAGQESNVFETVLFNNKNGITAVDAATGVIVAVRDADGEIDAEFIQRGFLLARSAGITNPANQSEFFDDSQAVFTPITDVQELLLGDIPSTGGRSIFLKLRVPPDALDIAGLTIQLLAGSGANTTPLPFYFNRAFGDGVVQEEKKQFFPAIEDIKIGSWTSVQVQVTEAYTGDEVKQFLIRVLTGGCPGSMIYECSDDGGSTFSAGITSALDAPTPIVTSGGVDEGLDVAFLNLIGGILTVGDQWSIDVETRPFQFRAGLTTGLEGFIGFGEALISNNRVFHQTPTLFSLAANQKTFVFLGVDGTFTVSTTSTPQDGKLLMGWFETDSNAVIAQNELFFFVTLGLDVDDDFAPIPDRIVGLTWSFFQGRFRKFTDVIRIPPDPNLIGTLSLIAGATNFIQVDTIIEDVITNSTGFLSDNIPLFRVVTGLTFMEEIFDDRTLFVAGNQLGSLKVVVGFTTSAVGDGGSVEFDELDIANRSLVKTFTVTPTIAGGTYTVEFHSKDTKLDVDLLLKDTHLPNPFTSNSLWFYEDEDATTELHGRIRNFTGATQQFNVTMIMERFS